MQLGKKKIRYWQEHIVNKTLEWKIADWKLPYHYVSNFMGNIMRDKKIYISGFPLSF